MYVIKLYGVHFKTPKTLLRKLGVRALLEKVPKISFLVQWFFQNGTFQNRDYNALNTFEGLPKLLGTAKKHAYFSLNTFKGLYASSIKFKKHAYFALSIFEGWHALCIQIKKHAYFSLNTFEGQVIKLGTVKKHAYCTFGGSVPNYNYLAAWRPQIRYLGHFFNLLLYLYIYLYTPYSPPPKKNGRIRTYFMLYCYK